MRNVISILIAGLLVILVIVAVVINYNIKSNKEAEEYYKVIGEKIIEEENRNDLKEFKTFYTLDKYGIRKEENKVYLYAYVIVENYYINDDGKVTSDSGYAIPHRFEFENGEYVGATIPKDGTYYESSLKEMYPLTVRMKMDFFKNDEKLNNNIKQQVEEFYSISYEEIVY